MIPAPVRTAERFESVVISPEATIAEGLRQLERAGTGALLLCESDRTFVGLLTDGDVRRAILASIPFSRPCRSIAKIDPVVAPADIDRVDALRLMDHAREFVLDQLPLVDDRGRAVGLLLRSDVVTVEDIELSAVIMAGGFGKRLLPLTEHTPKPMLPIGDRPLLEHTISRLRDAGIRRVAISTHHLADRITDHFGNGNAFGVNLQYMSEDQPLGTAGALRLMGDIQEPVLVINGDIPHRAPLSGHGRAPSRSARRHHSRSPPVRARDPVWRRRHRWRSCMRSAREAQADVSHQCGRVPH